jgi:hypothetical protein
VRPRLGELVRRLLFAVLNAQLDMIETSVHQRVQTILIQRFTYSRASHPATNSRRSWLAAGEM